MRINLQISRVGNSIEANFNAFKIIIPWEGNPKPTAISIRQKLLLPESIDEFLEHQITNLFWTQYDKDSADHLKKGTYLKKWSTENMKIIKVLASVDRFYDLEGNFIREIIDENYIKCQESTDKD